VSGEPVILRKLGVHRMPGIPRAAGFVVEGLQPGVNVVIGPNGSGKTTMVRAIEELFWPGRDRTLQPSLSTTLTIEGTSWQAEVEGRSVRWRREGTEAAAPDVGTPELRHRYRLALAEMVNATEQDNAFSNEVSRAMVGGFDLAEVGSAGSYGSRPSGMMARRTAAQQAHQQLEQAMQAERALEQRRTRELPELERELESARAAERLERACGRAVERQESLGELTRLETARDALPLDQLRACHANDRETLSGLERRRDELTERRDHLRQAIDAATHQLGSATIPDEGVPAPALDRLDALATAIEEDERRGGDIRRDRPGVEAERDACFARLGSVITAEQIATLSATVSDTEAEELARAAHMLAGEREALAQRRARLPGPDALEEAETLTKREEGYRALGRWMGIAGQAPTARPARRVEVILLAAVGVGLSVALAVIHHWLWATAVIPVAVVAWFAWRAQESRDPDSAVQRKTFEAEFERLALGDPVAWTPDGVTARMRDLAEEIVQARTAQSRRDEHRELDRLERDLAQRESVLGDRRAEFEKRLGVSLPGDDGWLPVFTSNLRRWQETHDRLGRMDAQRSTLDREIEDRLDEAGRTVQPFGEPRPTDGTTLRRACDGLRELSRAADARAADRAKLSDNVEPALTEAETAWEGFFGARGLAAGDADSLDRVLEQLDDLEKLDREIEQARGAVDPATTALQDHPDLLELTIAELQVRRDEAGRQAVRRDELVQATDRIRQDLSRARAGHTVADARAAHRAVLDDLRAKCVEEGGTAVGRALLERIGALSRESSLPAVFDRSRQIFARVTAGRFELRPPDPSDGLFHAYDTVDAVDKTVNQLSTGERVQLLLAVRLGFLEHQERHPMPLLLDETLGTSDDDRVREIMDALIDISREGRQILYFTAQQDEAGKWAARLEAGGLPNHVVDLGAIRSGGRTTATPLEIRPVSVSPVPPPDDRDHAAYGSLLDVPGIHPSRVEVSQVHLWHVIDNTEQLHILLSRKIGTIGQFLTYERYGGRLPAGVEDRTVRRIHAAARGLEHLFEAWRLGRSRPIELPQILDTGAVSSIFETPITELLAEVGHDPVRLLEALDAGHLDRWRHANTETIRETLQAAGVLPEGDPLSAGDLEVRLRATLSQEIDTGLLDASWIRRIVASLPDLDA